MVDVSPEPESKAKHRNGASEAPGQGLNGNEKEPPPAEAAEDDPDFDLKLNPEQQISLAGFTFFWGTLTVYSLLGAWVFQLLEREPELRRINATHNALESARGSLLRRLEEISCSSEARFQLTSLAIREYELALDAIVNGGLRLYFNATVDPADTNWGLFPKASAFVVTLTTTIGYGNISPHTPVGRIFCIFYSLVGIPLMLIAISKSGKAFARLSSRAYRRVCGSRFDWKYLQATAKDPNRTRLMVSTSVSVTGALIVLFVYIGIGAGMYKAAEGWSYLDAFYFCFITLTTIGLGDLTPHIETTPTIFAVMRSVYILVGLAITSTAIELVRKQYTIWNRPWQRKLQVRREQIKAALAAAHAAHEHAHAKCELQRASGGGEAGGCKLSSAKQIFIEAGSVAATEFERQRQRRRDKEKELEGENADTEAHDRINTRF